MNLILFQWLTHFKSCGDYQLFSLRLVLANSNISRIPPSFKPNLHLLSTFHLILSKTQRLFNSLQRFWPGSPSISSRIWLFTRAVFEKSQSFLHHGDLFGWISSPPIFDWLASLKRPFAAFQQIWGSERHYKAIWHLIIANDIIISLLIPDPMYDRQPIWMYSVTFQAHPKESSVKVQSLWPFRSLFVFVYRYSSSVLFNLFLIKFRFINYNKISL